MNWHVDELIAKSTGLLYALKILRSQGLDANNIHQIYHSIIISRLLYASPSWWGFVSQHDKNRLQSFLNRSLKFDYCKPKTSTLENQIKTAERRLFKSITADEQHILYGFLPPKQCHRYSLRPREHDYSTSALTVGNQRSYVNHMLFDLL